MSEVCYAVLIDRLAGLEKRVLDLETKVKSLVTQVAYLREGDF